MDVKMNVPLAPLTTLGVGGDAAYYVSVQTENHLHELCDYVQRHELPSLIIGSGSNLCVSDAGYDGIVIHNQLLGRRYKTCTNGRVHITCGAGEIFDDIVAETVANGLWGLENLSHIPGTVGATPVQNVGAYGVDISDLCSAVMAHNLRTGEVRTFTPAECGFGYRDSFFKTVAGQDWCITQVSYELSETPNPKLEYSDLCSIPHDDCTLASIRGEVISIRSRKFPDWHSVGTAGSFFKNPIIPRSHAEELRAQYPDLPIYPMAETESKISLGYVLDKICQLRGVFHGEVGLSSAQALVLINHGSSAAAVQAFVSYVRTVVYKKTGITIEQEVRSV